MSTLEFTKKPMHAAKMNGESSLPPLSGIGRRDWVSPSALDPDDELYVSYGSVPSSFPYRDQDNYTRELYDTDVSCAVLENEYLRAEFMPEYGGKLWSLYDKKAGRELLFANPVARPCNLAIRNAWTSGGVEWNCGFLGHHPHTCSTLYTAKTTLGETLTGVVGTLSFPADTPVLRMYEYERLRGMVYEMNFFLPDGCPVLLCRMRITNPNDTVTPIYWWSNIAVPELKEGRVIAPVTQTYTYINGALSKAPVPDYLDTDITYPVNQKHSIDFFWKIPNGKRRYISQLDANGYGLVQSSTERLKGRKLFVWGQGPGGDRWQEYLSGDGCKGRYVEIQAGLAATQYESLPMPPKSSWEWLEAYGALNCDGAKIHGDWEGAKREAEDKLDRIITSSEMERILLLTKPMSYRPAEEMVCYGSGWGKLENLRREKCGLSAICPHLDFGELKPEQAQWKRLLDRENFGCHAPDAVPDSYLLGGDWADRIEKAARIVEETNWYAQLQYGMTLIALRRFEEAEKPLEKSFALEKNPWALYGLAQLARIGAISGGSERCAMLTLAAAKLSPHDISLAKEAVRILAQCGKYADIIEFESDALDDVTAIARMKLYLAQAYAKTGDAENAEKLLYSEGGMVVADIREGEVSMSELWYEIEEIKAKRENRTFDRATAKPPKLFDFRMEAES